MAEYIEREKIGLTDFEIAMCSGDYKEGLKMLLDKIESIPAADVQPVVRGEWIVSRTDYGWNCAEYPTHCKCTVCGREVPYQDKDNYCPNCGAMMEES